MSALLQNNTLRWTLTIIGVVGFLMVLIAVIVELVRVGLPVIVWAGLVVFSVWGFVVRAVIEGKTARQRERDAQDFEMDKWGFFGDGGQGPWLNFYQGPLIVQADAARDYTFYSEWLVIHDGHIIVNPGESEVDRTLGVATYHLDKQRTYAWNGSTPKAWFHWLLLFSAPDWFKQIFELETIAQDTPQDPFTRRSREVYWQMAHKATLLHDALYQYLKHIPIPKEEVDVLFRDLLKEAGMPGVIAVMYHLAVHLFGGLGVSQTHVGVNSEYQCASFDGIV